MIKSNSGCTLGGFLLIILFFIVFTIQPAQAYSCSGIPDEECNVLYALYNSTNGDQWTNNTNWLSSSTG